VIPPGVVLTNMSNEPTWAEESGTKVTLAKEFAPVSLNV